MKVPLLPLTLTLVFVSTSSFVTEVPAASCTHYAAPNGSGSGSSSGSPFKIGKFWSVAKPGHTLCLLDGRYTGADSMITPPQNLSGTASAPITVRAINDGKVTIDGQGSHMPVRLYRNHYFVLEGFNAANSKTSVVALEVSTHNIVRRVAAWDAADTNTNIFGIHGGGHNLLEDVAGWGIARKIFSASQDGDYTTIRRAWGRWEGSHVVGPKMTYTLAYKNYNLTCENCIGTWSGQRQKKSYTLLDYYGKPWTGKGAGTFTNYHVDQPYGIFSLDGLDSDKHARTKLLGSIAYIGSSDRFAPSRMIFVTRVDSFEVGDTIAYIQPGSHSGVQPFSLNNLTPTAATNLIARNLIAIGTAASTFGSQWRKTQVSEAKTVTSKVATLFSSNTPTNICYRYKNRVLTKEPLWPWPMNQRIKDAMIQSGRTTVDVTKTIETIFGPIPSSCKGPLSSNQPEPSSSTPPTAPLDLIVNQL